MLEKFFQLSANQTTVRKEIIAGLTTFAAMAYIIAVNPGILSATGMDLGALITATALASAIMTAIMALMTNYPIALAPGMGLNAFFAFTICLGMKIPWQAALGLVFYSGLLFLLLSVTGVRQKIIEAIPYELKIAITCGIGLFIAFIGLQKGGLIADSPATLITMGSFKSPSTLLVLFGVILAAILVQRGWRGAIILTVLLLTAIGFLIPAPDGKGQLTTMPEQIVSMPASLAPTFLQLDLMYFWQNLHQCLPLVLALLFMDLFDNMGSLIGVCKRAGLVDAQGNIPKIGRALTADATAAMVGSCLGTSTVTTYIESAAGVKEGGHTGLTAIVVSVCFLLALFFTPIIKIIPAFATAPALIIVGIFMMQEITSLDLHDFAKAVPAFITILMIPLTFSISEGIAIGFVVYVTFMLGLGRAKEVTPLAYLLGAIFLLQLITR